MPKSKSDLLIIKAVECGYYADSDGYIYNPKGNKLQLSKTNTGYLGFMPSFGVRKERRVVLAHRFVVYYFFRDVLFDWPLVRHLNDVKTDNSIANLAVGTKKDNRQDIGFEKLSEIAKSQAHTLVALSRKLTDDQILDMRNIRQTKNTPYHLIAKQFNVSAMTVYRAINKISWSNV